MGKCRRARRDGPGPWQPLHIPRISHLSSWGENLKLSFSPKEKIRWLFRVLWCVGLVLKLDTHPCSPETAGQNTARPAL